LQEVGLTDSCQRAEDQRGDTKGHADTLEGGGRRGEKRGGEEEKGQGAEGEEETVRAG
jgi:hypothetical protein